MDKTDELIARCVGDPDALRALIGMFEVKVHGYITHLAGRSAADDLFQEVWLKVFRGAPRYEPRGQGSSWIFRIATNVCMDHFDRLKRDRVIEADQRSLPPPPDRGPGALLEGREIQLRAAEAVAALPLEQRQVFLMREFGRIPFKDIAAALDIPLGTALSRMSAALGKLRAALAEFHA